MTRRLLAIALASAMMVSPAMVRGDTVQNSGNCVIIIQGNGNSAAITGCIPLPTYPPEPRYYHLWQTSGLGIRFEQDGKWVPIYPSKSGDKVVVDLAPKPFVIWVPADNWPDPANDLPALQLSVSWDEALLRRPSDDLFAPATGMATGLRGDGRLILVSPTDFHPGHNYIVGHRFDRQMSGYRGLFVSLIDLAPASGRNLIEPQGQAFMALLMQKNDMPNLPGVPKGEVTLEDAPRDNVELVFDLAP